MGKAKNKKKNVVMLTINGKVKSKQEWQDFYKVSDGMLAYRMRKLGMNIENALSISKNCLPRQSATDSMIGKQFGNVKVIDKAYNSERKEWEFRCRCGLCGGEFVCRKDHLKRESWVQGVCQWSDCKKQGTQEENGDDNREKFVDLKIFQKKQKRVSKCLFYEFLCDIIEMSKEKEGWYMGLA